MNSHIQALATHNRLNYYSEKLVQIKQKTGEEAIESYRKSDLVTVVRCTYEK